MILEGFSWEALETSGDQVGSLVKTPQGDFWSTRAGSLMRTWDLGCPPHSVESIKQYVQNIPCVFLGRGKHFPGVCADVTADLTIPVSALLPREVVYQGQDQLRETILVA